MVTAIPNFFTILLRAFSVSSKTCRTQYYHRRQRSVGVEELEFACKNRCNAFRSHAQPSAELRRRVLFLKVCARADYLFMCSHRPQSRVLTLVFPLNYKDNGGISVRKKKKRQQLHDTTHIHTWGERDANRIDALRNTHTERAREMVIIT